jgi:hypothetical protein
VHKLYIEIFHETYLSARWKKYAPFIYKIHFKMIKSLGKNICLYISRFYFANAKFRENGYFCGLWKKKDKRRITKRLILVPNFCYFYKDQIICQFFLETTSWTHRTCMEMYLKHFYLHFHIFKYIKDAFQIKDAYAPRRKYLCPNSLCCFLRS